MTLMTLMTYKDYDIRMQNNLTILHLRNTAGEGLGKAGVSRQESRCFNKVKREFQGRKV